MSMPKRRRSFGPSTEAWWGEGAAKTRTWPAVRGPAGLAPDPYQKTKKHFYIFCYHLPPHPATGMPKNQTPQWRYICIDTFWLPSCPCCS